MTEGARNFHFLVNSASMHLTPEEKRVVAVTLRNNSYFAHPENLLLSALLDSRIEPRKFAVQKILNARKRTSTEVR